MIQDNSRLEEMSKMALHDPSTGTNPKTLTQEDFLDLYKNAYEGKMLVNIWQIKNYVVKVGLIIHTIQVWPPYIWSGI